MKVACKWPGGYDSVERWYSERRAVLGQVNMITTLRYCWEFPSLNCLFVSFLSLPLWSFHRKSRPKNLEAEAWKRDLPTGRENYPSGEVPPWRQKKFLSQWLLFYCNPNVGRKAGKTFWGQTDVFYWIALLWVLRLYTFILVNKIRIIAFIIFVVYCCFTEIVRWALIFP